MISRARPFIGPAYLFCCLVLGGSAQGIWQNMILQLVGVGIIAWAACDRGGEPLARPARQLLALAILGIAVVVLQLAPLPSPLWAHLGPRQEVAHGFTALGMKVPFEPLSLAPASGLASLFAIIPSLALFCAMVRLRAYRPLWVGVAVIAGTLAGIALGALQVASANGQPQSPWYLYDDSNWGKAVGFFANADHMATLLVITIPFAAALVAPGKRANMQRYSAIIAVAAGLTMVVVVGLALNGSLAGYALAIPVIAASVLLILPQHSALRPWVLTLAAILMIGGLAAVESSSIAPTAISAHASSAVDSRTKLLSTTARAAADFLPFGSGLGSFPRVYPLYEKTDEVTSIYAVHAHNDYAEVTLELGLPGILLIALFLAWWAAAVWRAWRTAEASPFARAAAIASAAVLVHSLVDFPLRTAAISACFGMCIALLADSRAAPPKEMKQLRRSRHLEFK